MDPQVFRTLVGSLLLLIVVLLPTRQASSSRRGFLGFLLGMVATVCGVALLLHSLDFVTADEGEAIVKSQIEKLQKQQLGHVPKNLIIIEGSSQTELGIDGDAVEQQLRDAGYDATVVELAGAGGNHLERYTLLSRLSEEMKRAGLVTSPNTRLLLEVAPEYDENPVTFFVANKDTLRGYHYSTLGNLWFAHRSLQIIGGKPNYVALAAILRGSLISTFDIGLVPQMQRFDDLEPVPAFRPAARQASNFHFHPFEADVYVRKPAQPLNPKWIHFSQYRAGRISALFGGGVTGVGYFSVPTVDYDKQMRYGHSFCSWRGAGVCVDATDPKLYGELDSADDYFNNVHLSAKGAVIYSKYFAEQLIAQGAVIK
jgi:hypothetical protein